MSFRLSPTFSGRLAQSDRPLAGMWACTGSTVITEICASSGLDWLLIDMEHSPIGLESVLAQLQTVAAYPITPVVRVPANDTVTIKQVLDLGAQNILIPMVNTADEARAAVEAAHYPPRGRRGVGSALARSARWNRVENYLTTASETVSVVVQIETAEAVANAAEIARVEGVNGIFIGPSDLAASMGIIGQQSHPDVVAAVESTIRIAIAAGIPAGVNAFDHGLAQRYVAAGANFVLVGADVALLARASERLAATWTHGSESVARESY